ncbi:MAG: hypothetical protein AAF690_12725 [Acidobacteriota bacterium]
MATIARSVPSPRVMGLVNPMVKFIVNRGCPPVAKQLMVLHWTGRKSGRAFSTPVSRLEHDGRLFTKTRAGYKHNFIGGGPAELVLDGERRKFVATAVESPDAVAERMRSVLDELGTRKGARAFGLKIEGNPTKAELAAFAAEDGSVVIDFEPV